MRRYFPIWHRIKTNGHCKVAVPLAFRRRVIKAIWKEKDLDLEYKLTLLKNAQRATLISKCSGSMVEFRLKFSVGLDELGA